MVTGKNKTERSSKKCMHRHNIYGVERENMEEKKGVLNLQSLKLEDFGVLADYIREDSVTDINWNGNALWIDDLEKGRYSAEERLSNEYLNGISTKLSNVVSRQFNKYNPILEAETADMRVSVIHSEVANTGTVLSIRKVPPRKRLTKEGMEQEGYCPREAIELLETCMKAKLNVVVSGLPGAGKTELLKYLGSYIKKEDRVITMEDNLELHFPLLYPEKDCVEFKISPLFSYTDAIKASLRLLPDYLVLSEIRSVEAKYLLEALSTGVHCMSTVHADSADKIPDRIQSMSESSGNRSVLDDVYRYIDVGIHIRKRVDENGRVHRFLDEICMFEREKELNQVYYLMREGNMISNRIPQSKLSKIELCERRAGN